MANHLQGKVLETEMLRPQLPVNARIVNSSSHPVPVTGTLKLEACTSFYASVAAGGGTGATSHPLHQFTGPFVIEYVYLTATSDVSLGLGGPGFMQPLSIGFDPPTSTVSKFLKVCVGVNDSLVVSGAPDFGFVGIVVGRPL